MRQYFVDTENVGLAWTEILEKCDYKDQIFLFYTENAAKLDWQKVECILNSRVRVCVVECSTGTNALDFQLVSVLGLRIGESHATNHEKLKECEYIIISNDKGYDAVISLWGKMGINIKRVSEQTEQKKVQKIPNKKVEERIILECFYRDEKAIRSVCARWYGQQRGNEAAKRLVELAKRKEIHSYTADVRIRNFLEILFERNTVAIPKDLPKTVYEMLLKHATIDEIRTVLISKYGEKAQQLCNPYIKRLKKMVDEEPKLTSGNISGEAWLLATD